MPTTAGLLMPPRSQAAPETRMTAPIAPGAWVSVAFWLERSIEEPLMVNSTLFRCSALLVVVLFSSSAPGAGTGSYIHSMTVNGYPRKAKIYPPPDTSVPAPVLFYFHGYSGDVEDSDTRRRFQTYFPEAVVVYAEGRYPYNSEQPEAGWRIRFPYINTVCGENEDLIYVDLIMAHLRSHYVVDENRVYASGHSSGAFFTLALMELKPDLFKGFAMLGAYSRYRVDASRVDCSDDVHWTSATPLELSPTAYAATPRPVLYMFGAYENFDYDGPDALRSYSTSCNEDSRFRNTVDQLLIRNRGTIPGCIRERNDYIKIRDRQVFAPWSANGAETQVWLYGGGHGWEDFPEDANQVVVDYFQSLPPRWEIIHKGSTTFQSWKEARSIGVAPWSNVVFADFNGDGGADVFERKTNGLWKISYLAGNSFGPWQDVGSAGDTELANMRFADFNSDGKTDVYRRLSNGQWQINYIGSNGAGTGFGAWRDVGSAGDTSLSNMVFADFNGDGKADVYRRLSNGQWQVNYMGSNGAGTGFGAWHDVGSAGDTSLSNMVFADFSGDRKADAYRRLSNGQWQINYMGSNGAGTGFGAWHDVGSAGDTSLSNMVFADFNGDGKADVYRRLSNGQWQINYMGSNGAGTGFGAWHDVGSAGDTQLADTRFADFNADRKTDVLRLVE
jgi:predicted esterase